MVKKLTEKQIETQILQWLNAQPDIFAFKVNTVGIFDPVKKIYRKNKNPFLIKGTSDILGSFKGRFFAIEVKRSHREKLSEAQLSFLSQVSRHGGIAVRTNSLDGMIKFVEQLRTEI